MAPWRAGGGSPGPENAEILREDDPVADREPGAEERGGRGDAEPHPQRAGGLAGVLGEVVERVLDRGAEILQRRAGGGARVEAGIDRVGQLARQVGAEAA